MALKYCLVLSLCVVYVCGILCPKQCDCDLHNGLNRATCIDQNIISIDVGVPNVVQEYSLSRNFISELDNYCFKEISYNALQSLDLSYNLIFWIGLHAFSGLEELAHLDLSNNRLRFISSDLFLETPQLQILDLSANVFESLKNEPFIIHSNLQVLNLNSCRIKSFPTRVFTRLPNLRKLDLSENYVISLYTDVLRPIRKLQRLELRNDYWQCNPQFLALEAWITARGIFYEKQCQKNKPKMMEKMISSVTVERQNVNIDEVWNVTAIKNETIPEAVVPIKHAPFQKFDSTYAFILGLEIGLGVGVVATYLWLTKMCKFPRLNCTRPQTRRQRRRAQRAEGGLRTNLLWNNGNVNTETPPIFRRQLSMPDRSPAFPTYGIPEVQEAALQIDAIRLPDRGETPPPPYHECQINL